MIVNIINSPIERYTVGDNYNYVGRIFSITTLLSVELLLKQLESFTDVPVTCGAANGIDSIFSTAQVTLIQIKLNTR